jgi:GTP1/Obg family GTP-binding protein
VEENRYTKIKQEIEEGLKEIKKTGFGRVEVIIDQTKRIFDIIVSYRKRIKR